MQRRSPNLCISSSRLRLLSPDAAAQPQGTSLSLAGKQEGVDLQLQGLFHLDSPFFSKPMRLEFGFRGTERRTGGGRGPYKGPPPAQAVAKIESPAYVYVQPKPVDQSIYTTMEASTTASTEEGRRDHEEEDEEMEPHEHEDLTRLLPSDALAEALRRLPRRGLAVARCVCKSWRSVLLAAARRPADDPEVPAGLAYLPPNPDDPDKYLVFDPAVSMHFEVVAIDRLLWDMADDPAILASEWPPSPCTMLVFSSRTWQWEERNFIREGEAAGTVADMQRICPLVGKGYSAFWEGELYLQCESNFVTRISLSDNKYQVIKPPRGFEVIRQGFCLGKSEKGVCCGLVDYSEEMCWLRVWILEELCGKMEWVWKHQTDLQPLLTQRKYDRRSGGAWILYGTRYYQRQTLSEHDNKEAIVQVDNDNGNEGMAHMGYGFIDFLGFHPYKDTVFLTHSLRRGLAYDLNNSKVEDLGNMFPRSYRSSLDEFERVLETLSLTRHAGSKSSLYTPDDFTMSKA
nr:unnamed protein product [Digitaria exilis]